MKSTLTAIALCLTAIKASVGEIDLTPIRSEYIANGSKIQQLQFKDGRRQIEYEPPAGWNIDGDASQITLRPKATFAQAAITLTPLNKPQPIDDTAIKSLAEKCLSELPVGSQFAKIEEQTSNPVLLGGNESAEITVSYQITGEKFVRSTLVVNLNDTQLIFRLTAKKNDFSSLHRDFKTSLFSWHWTEEKEEPTQAGAAQPATSAQ